MSVRQSVALPTSASTFLGPALAIDISCHLSWLACYLHSASAIPPLPICSSLIIELSLTHLIMIYVFFGSLSGRLIIYCLLISISLLLVVIVVSFA